jgi:TP901 family phage tail tape measure protein
MADVELGVVLQLRDQLNKQFKRSSAVFEKQTRSMTKSMTRLRSSIVRAAAALGLFMGARAAIRGTVGDAISFEKQMAEVSTLIDESTGGIRRLGNELLKIGAEFAQPPEALSKGLYDALSAGLVGAGNSMAFMRDASKLATAGVTDVSTAIDLLTSVMNAYNIPAEKANEVSDTLFATVKLGKTTITELASAVGRVAPAAQAAGLSLEEMGAALAVMTQGGLSSEESSTALRAALVALTSLTEDQIKAAREYGVELSTSALRAKGAARFFAELGTATDNNIDKVSELIPNVRALIGVLRLGADEGARMSAAMEVMRNKAGLNEEAFGKMRKTTGFLIGQVRGELRRVLILLGREQLPLVIEAAKDLKKWLEDNRKEIRRFGRAVAATVRIVSVQVGRVMKTIAPLIDEFLILLGARIAFVTTKIAGVAFLWAKFITTAHAAGWEVEKFLEKIGLTFKVGEGERLGDKIAGVAQAIQDASASVLEFNIEMLKGIGNVKNIEAAWDKLIATYGNVDARQKEILEQIRSIDILLAEAFLGGKQTPVRILFDLQDLRKQLFKELEEIAPAFVDEWAETIEEAMGGLGPVLTGAAKKAGKDAGREAGEEMKSELQAAVEDVGPQTAGTIASGLVQGFADGFADVEDVTRRFLSSLSEMFAAAGIMQFLQGQFPGLFPSAQAKRHGGTVKAAQGALLRDRTVVTGGGMPNVLAREGSQDEAYVPLTRGRIPVEVRGGGGVSIGNLNIAIALAAHRGADAHRGRAGRAGVRGRPARAACGPRRPPEDALVALDVFPTPSIANGFTFEGTAPQDKRPVAIVSFAEAYTEQAAFMSDRPFRGWPDGLPMLATSAGRTLVEDFMETVEGPKTAFLLRDPAADSVAGWSLGTATAAQTVFIIPTTGREAAIYPVDDGPGFADSVVYDDDAPATISDIDTDLRKFTLSAGVGDGSVMTFDCKFYSLVRVIAEPKWSHVGADIWRAILNVRGVAA